MEKLTLSGGFTPKLSGTPDLTMIRLPHPPTVGLPAGDIPFIRSKLLVREGDSVRTGTPLFTDKRDPSVLFVSPATGKVNRIVFGARRRLLEVVISAEPVDEWVEFDPVSPEALGDMPKPDLVHRLKQGGLWQALRQFPVRDTADPDHTPAMIIVSMNGNDVFSPHPALVIGDRTDAFRTGLAALERFSDRVVVTARQDSLKGLGEIPGVADRITHTTGNVYPAWNPGAVLYQLKKTPEENTAWCIDLPHLIAIGAFLKTGRYPVESVVTVTRDGDCRPHLVTRQGAPVGRLAGQPADDSLITTGQFNGRELSYGSHLGFFENTLNILPPSDGDEMFGFVRPGLSKPSVSATFLSSLFRLPARVDGTLHGELRACINCSYCERICPNGMMPSFIMKALHADAIEEALSLGLLDCCQCGLCSYTCPSKIELTQMISDGITAYHKDKA